MISIALVGFGYWGPNLARNISTFPEAHISWICDLRSRLFPTISRQYPAAKMTMDVDEVLRDTQTSAVIIATPLTSHVPLAIRALNAGKHVLVEKPLAPTAAEAQKLIRLAARKKRVLMVDHTYLYTPEVQKIREIIHSGELGKIFYVDSVRTNLGLVQSDMNVIFDLATHDFSIMDFLFGKIPKTVSATGFSHERLKEEAVAYISARYPGGLFFHTHVSWLSPVKIRMMIFVGTKKMLLYNDMEPAEKIKVYDKNISVHSDPQRAYQLRVGYRVGSMVAPHLPVAEGLHGLIGVFLKAIATGKKPLTDGLAALRVVRATSAATASVRKKGIEIRL